MPMKFQKFPMLIHKEIIKNMDYTTVFNMSLCSTKTNNTMKLVHFKQATALVCDLIENGCLVSIENRDRSSETIGVMCRGDTNYQTPVEVRFGNIKQTFEFDVYDRPYFQMHYDYDPNKPVESSMVQHIHSLFRQSLAIRLIIYQHESFDDVSFYQKVTEVHVHCTVTAQTIQYIKKHLDVHLLILGGKLTVSPEVSEIQNVYFLKAEEFARRILQNFNARTLYLEDAVCNNEDVLEFVSKWKNNNCYQNIVFVLINSKTLFDLDYLLAQIETTPWDEKTRPGTYKYYCPSFYGGPAFEFNTEDFRDIRRVDGKLASFNVQSNIFKFHVWD